MSQELPTYLVSTVDDVQKLSQRLARADVLALDTEYHSESRYAPELMLLQVATAKAIYLVDPRGEGGDKVVSELLRAVAASDALVLAHAAASDLAIFYELSGALPRRLFDTQLAAAFAGYGERPALADLLEDVLEASLDKTARLSDWSRRPLTPAMLRYAADDVRHLRALADALRAKLTENGRLAWVEEECSALLDPRRYEAQDPDEAHKFVHGRLDGAHDSFLVFRELAAERERLARELNRPRRRILRDEQLVDLALRAPASPQALAATTVRFDSSSLKQFSARWLAAVQRGQAAFERGERPAESAPPTPDERSVTELLLLRARVACRAQGVPLFFALPPLEQRLPDALRGPLGSADELASALGLTGWRRALLLEPLWAVCSGASRAGLARDEAGALQVSFT